MRRCETYPLLVSGIFRVPKPTKKKKTETLVTFRLNKNKKKTEFRSLPSKFCPGGV
jgi:hypothetical protein